MDSQAKIARLLADAESNIESDNQGKRARKIQKILKKKNKEEILKTILEKYYNSEELKPYQAELIKMQRHLERTKKKMVVLFDGRDASGKGGTIRRVTRYMNEKRYRVVAYEQNFFEEESRTILLKLYFSVSKEEQARRFERRKNDPLRQWKLSEVDLQAQKLWHEFSVKKFNLLKQTHAQRSPWFIVRSNDKHLARRETMKLILNSVAYRGRSRKLNFRTNTEIVIAGDRELQLMKKQKKQFGGYLM